MAIQTATTGQLEDAQRIVIAGARFTMEHNQPCVELVEHFLLGQGEKQITVPKVAQMTFGDLTDGVDIVDTQDIGMTTTDLTTAEVGGKVIITDKLARQENESVFEIVARQMGDGMGRKKNRDVIALFTALNGGVKLGLATKFLTLRNYQAVLAHARANKFPMPVFFVHHPNTVAYLSSEAAQTHATYPMPVGFSQELLRDFYSFVVNRVPVFETGDIDEDTDGDGIGCIASKSAMCVIDSKEFGVEPQRDASLRATELVVTADYGAFELDDSYGAGLTYDVTALGSDN